MTFSVYDVETSGTGTPLWGEAQSVSVRLGIYSVLLGTGTINQSYGTLQEALLFSDDLWLEVQIDSEVLEPRQQIASVGFAIRAGEADTVPMGAITTMMLENNAVTGDKIADGTVTTADIDDGSSSGLDADQLDGHDTSYFATAAIVTALQNQVTTLQGQVNSLVALLEGVNRPDTNTIRFNSVNVQIVNGLDNTEIVNGTGNLIVGYNEPRGTGDDRSGSHNIVVGKAHNYSSYGGLVVAYNNSISAPWASVSGGRLNTASGLNSSVNGGYSNIASYNYSNISGGSLRSVSGSSDWRAGTLFENN